MKVAAASRTRGAKFNARANTYTLSRAKTYLGRLVDKAMKGEPVYIIRGSQRFILQPLPEITPIPMRPPGYFADCYNREEIQLENKLSEASAIEKPEDLE